MAKICTDNKILYLSLSDMFDKEAKDAKFEEVFGKEGVDYDTMTCLLPPGLDEIELWPSLRDPLQKLMWILSHFIMGIIFAVLSAILGLIATIIAFFDIDFGDLFGCSLDDILSGKCFKPLMSGNLKELYDKLIAFLKSIIPDFPDNFLGRIWEGAKTILELLVMAIGLFIMSVCVIIWEIIKKIIKLIQKIVNIKLSDWVPDVDWAGLFSRKIDWREYKINGTSIKDFLPDPFWKNIVDPLMQLGMILALLPFFIAAIMLKIILEVWKLLRKAWDDFTDELKDLLDFEIPDMSSILDGIKIPLSCHTCRIV